MIKRFASGCYVGLLILYVLAGCRSVPLHGDESTILYMSSDFEALFARGDLRHLEYHAPPLADDAQDEAKQDLRVLNGVISKYVYGLTWTLNGLHASDLNQQWLWGFDLATNQAHGAIPSDVLLFICRWASGLMTALSVALMFAIGWRAGGWRTAYLTAFIYTMMPAILLNGRRAVFESALLLFSVLLIYVAQRAIGKLWGGRNVILYGSLIGAAAGLTIASKHTGVIVFAAVLAALYLYALIMQRFSKMIVAGVAVLCIPLIAAAVFLALNVSWWSNPLFMVFNVPRARQQLLNGQADAFGKYTDMGDRAIGLAAEIFSAPPQYFESNDDWTHWIGDQIARYEASGLVGLSGIAWSLIVFALFAIGLLRAIRLRRVGAVLVVLMWLLAASVSVYVLTPLHWQRYYLPLIMPVCVVCGMAITARWVTVAKPRAVA